MAQVFSKGKNSHTKLMETHFEQQQLFKNWFGFANHVRFGVCVLNMWMKVSHLFLRGCPLPEATG